VLLYFPDLETFSEDFENMTAYATAMASEELLMMAQQFEGSTEKEVYDVLGQLFKKYAEPAVDELIEGIALVPVGEAEEENIVLFKCDSFEALPGLGLCAKTGDNLYHAGNPTLFEKEGIPVDIQIKEKYNELCNQGKTPLFFACNHKYIGCIAVADIPKPDSSAACKKLSSMGIKTVMLTGDRKEAAEKICTEIGIDTLEAQLLPEDKLASLKGLKENNYVLAVGDGINDALALKEAHVGIAMGAMGSELAIQSADIALMNNNLLNIPFSIRLARRTKRIIYQNLALSIGISALMIGLSAFGVISPLAGSILHNVGAFAVLINSSRILKTQ
jgi:cation transport ATPase